MAKKTIRPKTPDGKKLKTQTPRTPQLSEAHRAVIDAWFANGCVSQSRAMAECGYSPSNKPHSIFGRPDIQAEVARRRVKLEARTQMTEAKIIAEYEKIAQASLGDLLEVNEDGSAYLDMNRLTFDQKAAMAEYQVETYTERTFEDGEATFVPVKKSRVKFHSKLQALDALARIKGMFKDKLEVNGAVSLIEKVAEARKRLAADKDRT